MDPLVTISKDGKITDVNKTRESVTGVTRKNLIGSDFSDYFAEPERAREVYKQVFEKGYIRDYPLAIRHTSGILTDVLYNAAVYKNEAGDVEGVFAAARDITEHKKAGAEREKLIVELQEALANVKTLSGMLPICASCKKIRDDKGYWEDVASYISRHSGALFSHGLCPECEKRSMEEALKFIRDNKGKDPSQGS
jgi:PAS domain S-box-containing protein